MTHLRNARHLRRLFGIGGALGALLFMAACGSSSTGVASPTNTVAATATASASPTATVTSYPIMVYFSKAPESGNSLTAVFPVARVSPTPQVETFSIQLLLAGPTPEERAAGYFSELNSMLNGPSVCTSVSAIGGPDFTLTLNMKGTTPEQGTATLKFCRATLSAGIGEDARVNAEMQTTLLQFASIKKVVVLNVNGNCFGDLSTQNLCLK